MTKTVEFCFDFVSPASYIAYKILPKIAAAANAEIVWTPIFLGGVMQSTGNRPPGTVEAKGRWMASDMARWVAMYELEYYRNDYFPVMTIPHMRGALAYREDPRFGAYCDAMYQAMWVDNVNLGEPAEIAKVLAKAGIDGDEFMGRIGDQTIKDQLKANTDHAVERGVFGAPTFFVGGNMHFGQDRLFMVAEDLGVSIHEALKR